MITAALFVKVTVNSIQIGPNMDEQMEKLVSQIRESEGKGSMATSVSTNFDFSAKTWDITFTVPCLYSVMVEEISKIEQ